MRGIWTIAAAVGSTTAFALFAACTGEDAVTTTPPGSEAGTPDTQASPTEAGLTNDIYVDRDKGKDDATGTEIAPLKTLLAAVKNAKKGNIIHLARGTYDDGNGETWAYEIPEGVTITTAARDDAVLVGPKSKVGLSFKNGGRLVNVKLSSFGTALLVEGGKLELAHVDVESSELGIVSSGVGRVETDDCKLSATTSSAIQVNATATAQVRNTTFSNIKSGSVIDSFDSSVIEIGDGSIENNTTIVAHVNAKSKMSFFGTKITNNSSGQPTQYTFYVGGGTSGSALLLFANASVSNNGGGINVQQFGGVEVQGGSIIGNGAYGIDASNNATVKVRNALVTNHSTANIRVQETSNTRPSLDLGNRDAGQNGGNTFTVTDPNAFGLWVDFGGGATTDSTLFAEGNSWSGTPSGIVMRPGGGDPTDSILAKVYKLGGEKYSVKF